MKQVLLILFCLLSVLARAQVDTGQWLPALPAYYSFIKYEDNAITRAGKLDAFYSKLANIRQMHKGRVTIIHIGDSHLQADGITSVLRNGFQDYFGDAGRGLVFPYQLAGSNAPHDVNSSSNTTWKSNRLTSPASPVKTGISGYGIHSTKKDATVNIRLKDIDGKQEHFNKMIFFLCSDSSCYRITDSNLQAPLTFNTRNGTGYSSASVVADSLLTGLTLTSTGMVDVMSFYGVSLEKKDSSGVLYHTIGVNGARLDQFMLSDLLWKQLKELNGDLFIVSLGTNEGQNPYINQPALMATCDSFAHMVHRIAPGAAILFTTPAGSYLKMKKPNAGLENVTNAIKQYCDNNIYACWDLFNISGGKMGATDWKKYELMSHDLVHYNMAGYQLQGQLLLNAFAKAYNGYMRLHPYKPAPVKTTDTSAAKPAVKDAVKKPVAPTTPKENPVKQPEVKPAPPVPVQLVPEPPKKGSHITVEYSY